jgi:hypothetical protein
MRTSTDSLVTLSTAELDSVSGGGSKLDTFVSQQRSFAKAELKGAVCDSKAIGLGEHLAQGLYGKQPTDQQSIDAINSVSNFCRSERTAPLGATRMPR